MENNKLKKVALFHPWIKSRGGAEKVVLELVRNRKDIDIYTWVYDRDQTFEEFKDFKINVIGSKIFQKFSRFYLSRGLFLFSSFFSKIPLEKYDKLLISTSGVGEFILFRNYKPKKTYAYVHTPLRAASKEIIKWNLKNRYNNRLSKLIYLSAVKIYRNFEKSAWKRIDFAIFNSELSLERAKERNLIRDKKTKIIYPPIDISGFEKLKLKEGDFFLSPNRFNSDKRQDVLLMAWENFEKKHPKEKLVLIGNIENKKHFKKVQEISKRCKNVEIRGGVEYKELLRLYENCKAVIYVPIFEDFGIVPFEALIAGKPVIAVDKGGYVKLLEQTPQFFKIKETQDTTALVREIEKTLENFITSKKVYKKTLIKNLSTYDFVNKFDEVLE